MAVAGLECWAAGDWEHAAMEVRRKGFGGRSVGWGKGARRVCWSGVRGRCCARNVSMHLRMSLRPWNGSSTLWKPTCTNNHGIRSFIILFLLSDRRLPGARHRTQSG